MRQRERRIARTWIGAAACALVSIMAARAAGAEEENLDLESVNKRSVLEVAADLSRRAEPDALATAALLYDSVNEHENALKKARGAARLAPERADLAWLELQLCTQARDCARDAPARRLLALDPMNGAAFMHELDETGNQARIDAALLRISQTERIDFYWNRLVIVANDTLQRTDFTRDDSSARSYSPTEHAVGMVAAVALPGFNRITTSCSVERAEDSTRRDLCLRIARALQRGDTIMAEALGMVIEERSWPLGSDEAAAAHERRESLRRWQEEQGKLESSEPEWTSRVVAALRTHRTEREAGDAVLAQYRAKGHTVPSENPTAPASVRRPSTSEAALERGNTRRLTQESGERQCPSNG